MVRKVSFGTSKWRQETPKSAKSQLFSTSHQTGQLAGLMGSLQNCSFPMLSASRGQIPDTWRRWHCSQCGSTMAPLSALTLTLKSMCVLGPVSWPLKPCEMRTDLLLTTAERCRIIDASVCRRGRMCAKNAPRLSSELLKMLTAKYAKSQKNYGCCTAEGRYFLARTGPQSRR